MIRVFAKKLQLEEVDLYLDKLVIKLPDDFAGELLLNQLSSSPAFKVNKSDDDALWTFNFADYKAFIEDLINFDLQRFF
jgi:hypothetical protein